MGKNYNGFEYHPNNPTPRPTIEEELWNALDKAKLIFPQERASLQPGEVNWEGCEYSKCGRTDKGVSAFGQVIGIRVRSNRPPGKRNDSTLDKVNGYQPPKESQDLVHHRECHEASLTELSASEKLDLGDGILDIGEENDNEDIPFDPIADEIPYPRLLNRLLPPDIRILAWCPELPQDFSARFSCRERQYRYFFTQPCFLPVPQSFEEKCQTGTSVPIKDGWLDINAMREAAKLFVGLHDFRNFCKVDASKQLTNFKRHIFHADIVLEDTSTMLQSINDFKPADHATIGKYLTSFHYPKVYSFVLHGSAFLWHQVRHMVAILFLVGQGLESPSIISKLLDVDRNPQRPMYEMATDTPLVLWNCVFPNNDDNERTDSLDWLYIDDDSGQGNTKYSSTGLMEDLWKVWRERKFFKARV